MPFSACRSLDHQSDPIAFSCLFTLVWALLMLFSTACSVGWLFVVSPSVLQAYWSSSSPYRSRFCLSTSLNLPSVFGQHLILVQNFLVKASISPSWVQQFAFLEMIYHQNRCQFLLSPQSLSNCQCFSTDVPNLMMHFLVSNLLLHYMLTLSTLDSSHFHLNWNLAVLPYSLILLYIDFLL